MIRFPLRGLSHKGAADYLWLSKYGPGPWCHLLKDIAGTEATLGTIADLHFTLTGQVDHILPSRRPMPVIEIAGRSVAEDDTVPRLELLDLHLVEMRLAVRPGVDSRNFHYSAPMFIAVWDSEAFDTSPAPLKSSA